MKQSYPTFIYDTKDGSEHSFLVYVPDMDIFTEGDNFADATEMARDAISLKGISMEDNNEKLPVPSIKPEVIKMAKENSDIVDFSQGILTYVDVDFSCYRKQIRCDKKVILTNLEESLKEMNLMREGKIPKRNWNNFKDQVNRQ